MSARPGAEPAQLRRAQLRVEGVVQGVGFRPYVYRLAGELGLAGFVLNDSRGVLLEVEGEACSVDRFIARLAPEAPPLALLDRVAVHDCTPTGAAGFQIRASPEGGEPDAPVTADSSTCAECMAELFDPADRRHRYPFINCTNCGPRFTIVRGVPYDRQATTMAGFAMCERCRAEYEDPGDRRFHAQPNACPICGPTASLLDGAGVTCALGDAPDAVAAAARALREGRIVAVKGLGGYHLACRADDESAVAALRARKQREDKPFALMVATLAQAGAIVALGPAERLLLSAAPRPIVLCGRRADATLARSIAPGVPELGVMLAYSPLHHLLLADFERELGMEGAGQAGAGAGAAAPVAALVMTSANVSDEPIAFRDEEARERLAGIADLFLSHDRPIQTRTDDSVMLAVVVPGGTRKVFLRRSRGYVPGATALVQATPRPLLACGAELKSTFCVAKGSRAWVSHHIGDLENYQTLRSFTEGIEHFQTLFAVRPRVVVHDLHPEYLSTKYALERDDCEPIAVQHHHAHLAACLAEHGEQGTAVGAIFDGAGYGTDGTIWGGELLVGDLAGFRRAGHLLSAGLPGGARAIREPWRMACAWLSRIADDPPQIPVSLRDRVDPARWRAIASLVALGTAPGPHAPATTSMGRLFDAVGALCGLRAEVTYEGQAAVELQAACDPQERGSYPVSLERAGEMLVIDPRPALVAVVGDLADRRAVGVVASRFHAAIADATVRACREVAAANATELVVLSGGVFQNRRLLEAVAAGLHAVSLRVLIPERLPVNDGGISYGQAAVAAHLLAAGSARAPHVQLGV